MDINALINSVFDKTPLWDQKDSQHHNRFVLDKMWDIVADEMNSTRVAVRSKWKGLRDTFRKELKRSAAEASSWKPSWQYFDSLLFLKDQFTARQTIENLPDVEQNTLYEDEEINESDVDESTSSNYVTSKKNKISSTTYTKGIKRKLEDNLDVGAVLVRLEETKLRILEETKKTSDEDASFFDSLLPHVRQLAPQNKMLLRMKIQELVYNFAYGSSNQNPTNIT